MRKFEPGWSEANLETAKRILSETPLSEYHKALARISKALGRDVTAAALRGAFQRAGLKSPTSYCKDIDAGRYSLDEEPTESADTFEESEPVTGVRIPELLEKLVAHTKKGPIAFQDLCDRLDLSPGKTRGLIDSALKLGVRVHVEHNHVGIRASAPNEQVKAVGIAPVVGEQQVVGVISDTHLGSKYCLRAQLIDFVNYAYEQGVREILHPGDVLDGMYRHGLWEVSHSGLDAQAQDLFETLPQLPGLNYRGITGNHDFTFTESSGVDVGDYLQNYFRKRGRQDLHFYGNRGAFLKVKGAVVHLWHPKCGPSYAKSYPLQRQVEKYSSLKPQILLTGHLHSFVYLYDRSVHAMLCPTFQGAGSAFSKSIGGSPAIGGLILRWHITELGGIRSFTVEKRSYFENEKPLDIHNDLDAIPVDAR